MFFRSMQFGDQWMDSRSGNFYIMWHFSSSPQVSSILKSFIFSDHLFHFSLTCIEAR